jgi:hypothetical protein
MLRRVTLERLSLVPDEIDCGHLPALAKPGELAERLERYRMDVSGAGRPALAGRAVIPRS